MKHTPSGRAAAFVVSLITTIGVSIALGCGEDKEEFIEVGVIFPATGQHANLGKLVRQGLSLAEKQLNREVEQQGDLPLFKFVYEDSEGNATVARRAFLDLVRRENLVGVVGSIMSSDTKGFIDEISTAGVPVIANGSSAPDLRGASEYFFRTWPADDYEGLVMGRFAADNLEVAEVVTVFADDPYPRGIEEAFTRGFERSGGRVLLRDSYEEGTSNFSPVVRKILDRQPAAIYAVGFPGELGRFVRELRAVDEEITVLSAVAIDAPEFFDLAGISADKIFYTAPSLEEGSLAFLRFRDSYKSQFGEEPEVVAAISYDSGVIVGKACLNTSCTRDAIREWISRVEGYDGASGKITFDHAGDVRKPIAIRRIERGETFMVEKAVPLRAQTEMVIP